MVGLLPPVRLYLALAAPSLGCQPDVAAGVAMPIEVVTAAPQKRLHVDDAAGRARGTPLAGQAVGLRRFGKLVRRAWQSRKNTTKAPD